MSLRASFVRKSLPFCVSAALFATIMHASAADKVAADGLYQIVVGDFDGDQMSDIIRQGRTRREEHSAVLAAVQQASVQRWQDGYLDTAWNQHAAQLVVGDFNGDASSDVLVQGGNPLATATIVHSYLDGRLGMPVQTIADWHLGLRWDAAHHRIFAADLNGDGKDDLVLQGATSADRHAVALADDKGLFNQLTLDFDNYHFNRDWSWATTTLATGDFDGNGRFELLLQPATGDQSTLIIGSDERAVLNRIQTDIPAQHLNLDWSSGRHRAVVGDFNGDGKDDVFLLAAHVVEQSAYLPSSDAGFERIDKVIERIPYLEQLKQVLVGDFDADGIDDLVLLFNDPNIAPMLLLADAARAARLAGFLRKLGLLGQGQTLQHEPGKSPTGAQTGGVGTGFTGNTSVVTSATAQPPKQNGAGKPAKTQSQNKTATAGVEPAWQEYGGSGGSFRVDESGAATYSIAIATPPGSGGVAPKLSLNYSSHAGNGIMGMGWSLGGLSAISRCRATKETDGANLPMSFGVDAKYCLGGQRLIHANQTLAAEIGSCPAGGSVLKHFVPEVYSGTLVTACKRSTETLANPAYFAVFQKDGSVSYYGNFNGSRADATQELNERNSSDVVVATSKTLFWAMARFSDSVGNYIDYRYTKNVLTGEHYASSILFSGNDAAGYPLTDANAIGRVDFVYEPRHDTRTFYSMGSVSQQTKRLSYVDVKGDKGAFRRYDLYYAPNNASPLSQLEYIQECRGSTCLPAIKFSWNRPPAGFAPLAQPAVDFTSRYRGGQPADLNGDGLLDFAWLYESTRYDRFYWRAYITKKQGSNYTLSWPDGGQPDMRADDAIEHDSAWYPFDFNGDGRQDVIYPNGTWKAVLAREDGALVQIVDTGVVVKNKRGVSFSDLNGDGLPDIAQLVSSEGKIYINLMEKSGDQSLPNRFATMKSFVVPAVTRTIKGVETQAICFDSRYLSAMDVHGDGQLDLAVNAYFASKCPETTPIVSCGRALCRVKYISEKIVLRARLYSLDKRDIVSLEDDKENRLSYELVGTESGYVQDLNEVQNSYSYFSDLNGDGLPDVVSRHAVGKPVSVLIGTGTGFKKVADLSGIDNSHRLQLIDHNGDGLTDILFPGVGGYRVMHFQSDMTFAAPVPTSAGYYDLDDNENQMFDLSGDGQPDLVKLDAAGDNHSLQIHLGNSDHLARNVIGQIEHLGTRAKTVVSYKALNKPGESIYAKGSSANTWNIGAGSPVFDVTGPMYVVNEAKSDQVANSGQPGAGMVLQSAAISYGYAGLRMQAGGRGSLGFESITTRDLQSGVTTTTTYKQLFPFTGMAARTEKRTSAGIVLSVAENGVASKVATLGGVIPYIDWSDERAYDAAGVFAARTITRFGVDGYGNNTSVSVGKYESDAGSAADLVYYAPRLTYTASSYKQGTSNLFYGRLSDVTVRGRKGEAYLPERYSAYEYYESGVHKNLLKAEIVEPAGNEREYLRTEYVYDAFGNKKGSATQSCHVARPGSNCLGAANSENPTYINRSSSVEYDPRGRFPVLTRNHYGQITEEVVERDALYNPTKVRGATGVVATTEYTTMGRAWRTSDTTGNWSETYLQRCNGSVTCLNGAVYRQEVVNASGARGIEHYDLLGRVVAKQASSFNQRATGFVTTLIEYDKFGNPVHSSWPFFSNTGMATQWEKTEFDLLGRVTRVTHPNGTISRSDYSGLQVTHTNELGQTRVEKRNAFGELEWVRDNAGKTIYYTYDDAGRLDTLSRVDNIGLQSDLNYDRLGRKTYMWDADKSPGARGVTGWRYDYNALGELIKQTDPRGYTSESWYDELGRVTRKLDKSNTGTVLINHSWNFASADTATAKAGQLVTETDAVSGYSKEYHYDGFGRPGKTFTRFDGNTFEESVEYNSIGQVELNRDITGKGLRYKRNDVGQVYEVQDADNASIVFQRIDEVDAKGNITRETLGNGARITRSYHVNSGFIERIRTEKAGNVLQNLYYQEWDAIGNLKVREDTSLGKNLREVFDYDGMNRLTSADARNGGTNTSKLMTLTYDSAGEGNLLTKSGLSGSYSYGGKDAACTAGTHVAAGPHAVSKAAGKAYCYDANGNQVSGNGRALSYANTFDLPTEIIGSNGHTTRYSYVTGGGRYKRTDTVGGATTTTYFVGSVEVIKKGTSTEYRRSIPNGIVSNGTPNYILKDHLGSTDIILDCLGKAIQTFSFDAFGNQRQASTWQLRLGGHTNPLLGGMLLLSPLSEAKTFHGFTGHEHVDELGLIHMNGRMFDPTLGRFLQADPYVQVPKNSQSLNRYSYLMNNPLNGTDPSGFLGEWAHNPIRAAMRRWSPEHAGVAVTVGTIACLFAGPAAAICAASVQAGGTYDNARAHGVSSSDARSAAFKAGVIAYVSAMVFNAIGDYFKPMQTVDAAGNPTGGVFGSGFETSVFVAKVGAHAMAGGVMSVMQGGKFGHGFVSAGVTQASGPAITAAFDSAFAQTVAAAIVGGTVSDLTGGKFANGAITSAFAWMFNENFHRSERPPYKKMVSTSREVALDPNVGGIGVELADTYDFESEKWSGLDTSAKIGALTVGDSDVSYDACGAALVLSCAAGVNEVGPYVSGGFTVPTPVGGLTNSVKIQSDWGALRFNFNQLFDVYTVDGRPTTDFQEFVTPSSR